MERRSFLQVAAGTAAARLAAIQTSQAETATSMTPIPVIANDPVIVFESPDAQTVYAYSPGLARLATGRLVATMDRGGSGVAALPGVRTSDDGLVWKGRVYTSDDRGRTWNHRSDMPLMHARPFTAGRAVYVIGHATGSRKDGDVDLGVMRSDDDGVTWTGPFWLTRGEHWHQAPCNVHYTRGRVYLVMERNTAPDFPEWPVAVLAPVLMAADERADLTKRASWTFSSELTYRQIVEEHGAPNLIGVPFFAHGDTTPDNPKDNRSMAEPGWLETNVVQFTNPDHDWYDASGRTFHLWMRAHTGSTNLAAIAKALEDESGKLTVTVERAPSGAPIVFVPCPGGQMKFHILYDGPTKLFWLLSSQATDSMTRPDRLPPNRYNLPNNERHRLVLHFSKNCVDWCFAVRVADTGQYGQSRNYASMVIDGDDLHVLSRSGDARAKSAHDGNLITFHTVPDFRCLVY